MSAIGPLLLQLRESTEFHAVMEDMKKHRPVAPRYHPCATAADEQMLLANIKFQTGMQEGFDVLFAALTGKRV